MEFWGLDMPRPREADAPPPSPFDGNGRNLLTALRSSMLPGIGEGRATQVAPASVLCTRSSRTNGHPNGQKVRRLRTQSGTPLQRRVGQIGRPSLRLSNLRSGISQ